MPTRLILNHQYETYQVLLEAHPQGELDASKCFSKIILYIMDWNRERITKDLDVVPDELKFLETDYPAPEHYKDFDISKVGDISKIAGLDVKTAYLADKDAWVFRLEEVNNDTDNKEVRGRRFITSICVYKQDKSIIVGARITCTEPMSDAPVATPYRPAFIKTISQDADIILTEAGVPVEYAFGTPITINGSSTKECNALAERFINNPGRQLPILFIPTSFYNELKETVDKLTKSFLAHGYVVILDKSYPKIFSKTLGLKETADKAAENNLVLYRNNVKSTVDKAPKYFKFATSAEYKKRTLLGTYDNIKNFVGSEIFIIPEGIEEFQKNNTGPMELAEQKYDGIRDATNGRVLDQIKEIVIKSEHIRCGYNFGGCSFEADSWNPAQAVISSSSKSKNDPEIKILTEEIDNLREKADGYKNDVEMLQEELDRTKTTLEEKTALLNQSTYKEEKLAETVTEQAAEIKELKQSASTNKSKKKTLEKKVSGFEQAAINEYKPLINLPPFAASKKKEIIDWINEYYSDELILHYKATQAFNKDKRNIDWKTFCLLIHFIAGYTKCLNEGKSPDNNNMIKYDPDGRGFKVEPISTGKGGSNEVFASDYTINIKKYNQEKGDVLMDMHMKVGRGLDANMIRIYFYYDKDIKKTIIGHMPTHLRTINNPT